MNKVFLILLIASAALAVLQAHQLAEAQYDRELMKEDVRRLTNDIDEYGDIDTYTGSDHFERLYEWSHNIKRNDKDK